MSNCLCGKKSSLIIGTVNHRINHKTIQILNISHYFCRQCQSVWYDPSKADPTKYLEYAYRRGLNVVDFNLDLS